MKVIIIILLISISILSVDDGVLRSAGGNVFLDSSNAIEMAREFVYIKMFRDSCNVYCKFWFFNHAKAQDVLTGFPETSDIFEMGRPLRNFRIEINGKNVDSEQKQEIDEQYPDSPNTWYTWRTYFPANDTTIIENWYTSDLDQG